MSKFIRAHLKGTKNKISFNVDNIVCVLENDEGNCAIIATDDPDNPWLVHESYQEVINLLNHTE